MIEGVVDLPRSTSDYRCLAPYSIIYTGTNELEGEAQKVLVLCDGFYASKPP